jgi:circadian clock protein KaiB
MARRVHERQVKEVKAAPTALPAEHAATPDGGRGGRYLLTLYVTGMTLRSMQAIANLRLICETRLQGRYELEVVDIYRHPRLARDEQIVAAPTLIKKLPLPLRRMVGNLSDQERVLMGLDLVQKA